MFVKNVKNDWSMESTYVRFKNKRIDKLTSTKFWVPLIWTVNTMVYGIANKVITNAGIGAWTLKAFGTTLLSNSLESRDYHLEAIFSGAPRICDIFQCDIVGLRKYDSVLTHAVAGLVTTDTFLQTYSWLAT